MKRQEKDGNEMKAKNKRKKETLGKEIERGGAGMKEWGWRTKGERGKCIE